MAQQFDRLGRHRKEYLPRLDPLKRWREEKFIAKYRLTPARVRWLTKRYAASGCSHTDGTNIGGGLSYSEQVTLALRYFATGASMVTVCETQSVTTGTVSRYVRDVTNFLYRDANKYIRWPNTDEAKIAVSEGFHLRNKKRPLVMGCVDGTHVRIISPKRDREAVFVNRKGFHSLNVMLVSDSRNLITHLDPCWAGSAGDSYIFNMSPMRQQVRNGVWGDFFLLGDSGYRLSKNLLTPYLHPEEGHQTRYNVWHKSTRSIVERTIGIMKQRWRCLDQSGGYLHHTPEKAAGIVTACACLHNLAVLDRTPHLDHLDDSEGAFVHRQEPLLQPRDLNNADPTDTRRDTYAKTWFARPDPVDEVAPLEEEEMEIPEHLQLDEDE